MEKFNSFAEDIEAALAPEEPLFAVIGAKGWSYKVDGEPVVREWRDVRQKLDYQYDDGYGSPDCHAVYVWSETQVAFVSQYDGSTNVCVIPRNPEDGEPSMPGGG